MSEGCTESVSHCGGKQALLVFLIKRVDERERITKLACCVFLSKAYKADHL